jgi:cytochrome c553
MKQAFCGVAATLIALAVLIGGCSSIERSRSLSNPAVPALTSAQQVCSNCHGLDGNSVSPNFPRLAGQMPSYLIAQLKEFRNHDRNDPPGFEYMWGISRSLSDQKIDGLAKYFSSQKPVQNALGNPKLAAEGEQIFMNGIPASQVPPCASCHGESAQGNDQFPRLAGQHADYVMKQLEVFKRGNERPSLIMEGVSHSLSSQDIAALANYVQGIPPR